MTNERYIAALNQGWQGLPSSEERAVYAISLAENLPSKVALEIAEQELEKHMEALRQSRSAGSGHVDDNYSWHITDLKACEIVVKHFKNKA